jgi:hypothetical protein
VQANLANVFVFLTIFVLPMSGCRCHSCPSPVKSVVAAFFLPSLAVAIHMGFDGCGLGKLLPFLVCRKPPRQSHP